MVEIAEFLNESNMLEKYRIMYNVYESFCKRLCDSVLVRNDQLSYQ